MKEAGAQAHYVWRGSKLNSTSFPFAVIATGRDTNVCTQTPVASKLSSASFCWRQTCIGLEFRAATKVQSNSIGHVTCQCIFYNFVYHVVQYAHTNDLASWAKHLYRLIIYTYVIYVYNGYIMIRSMSIYVHHRPSMSMIVLFFPVALQHHRTTPGLQRLTWDTFMPLISTSSAKLLSVPKVCDGIKQSQKPLLNQNPSSSPVHILGSLQRSYPAPPGICHTGTTHLMLKNMLGRRC